jgi:hypothetical protein
VSRERTQQGLRLFKVRAFNLPDHLVFGGRRVEHEVWLRHIRRVAYVSKSRLGIFVQIEIDVPDFPDAVLCPACGAVFERIHANENVRAGAILVAKPSLKVRRSEGLGAGNALERLAAAPVQEKYCDVILGRVQFEEVLRRGEGLHRLAGCFHG